MLISLISSACGSAAGKQDVPLSPPRSVPNGTIIKKIGSLNGQGILRIDNGQDVDAVAILSKLNDPSMIAVYIQRNHQFTITGIENGIYELYFQLGEDWDSEQTTFTQRRSLARFENPFEFRTTDSSYSAWQVTLYLVQEGTAATGPVSADQFPNLK
jgi:hypothetical protein